MNKKQRARLQVAEFERLLWAILFGAHGGYSDVSSFKAGLLTEPEAVPHCLGLDTFGRWLGGVRAYFDLPDDDFRFSVNNLHMWETPGTAAKFLASFADLKFRR